VAGQIADAVRVGVGAVITRHRQVLLLRRRGVHGAGTWSTPGGHLDVGESLVDCAIREAHEEVGLRQTSGRFLGLTEDIFPAGRRHYLTAWIWLGEAAGEPQLKALHEADAMQWFNWDGLPTPLFIPFAHLVGGEASGRDPDVFSEMGLGRTELR
jgi:8-oxo-dGTP diphosphatase